MKRKLTLNAIMFPSYTGPGLTLGMRSKSDIVYGVFMSLINNSFIITNAPGQRLYSEIAKALPIIDYHCHLDARAIWENKPFTDITQLWLEGDHYKWRAMRANGISEQKLPAMLPPKKNLQPGRKLSKPVLAIPFITGPTLS